MLHKHQASENKVKQHGLILTTLIYDQAKLWLGQEEGLFESISKKEIANIKQKQWTLQQQNFKAKMEELLFQNVTF